MSIMCRQFFYLLIIAVVAAALPAQADFRKESVGGRYTHFYIEGEIVRGDADKLSQALKSVISYPPGVMSFPPSVFLDGPGGDVVEAIRMGRMLRRSNYDVFVTSDGCFSSCALVFAGATNRPLSAGPIGIHRFHFRCGRCGMLGSLRMVWRRGRGT